MYTLIHGTGTLNANEAAVEGVLQHVLDGALGHGLALFIAKSQALHFLGQ